MRVLAALVLALVLDAHPAAAVSVPGTDGRLEVGGWIDGLAVVDTAGGRRQRPQALGVLRFDARPFSHLRGRLELRGRWGGPFEHAHAGIYSLVHAYQNHSPSLEVSEAYADLELPRTDVRIGIQKLAWGRLDGLPPTDVVNARDFHDPFITEIEEAKIGVPAVLATHYLPSPAGTALSELRASLLFLPMAVPSRLALLRERWFPSSLSPGTIVIPRRQVELAVERLPGFADFDVVVPEDVPAPGPLATVNNRPPVRWSSTGIAGRLAGTWRGTDFALTHYTGPEAGPNVDLRSEVILSDLRFNPSTSELNLALRSRSQLRQAFDRIHMTGADFATTLGPATIRAEGAFFQNRPFLRLSSELFTSENLQSLLARSAGALFSRGRAHVPLPPIFPTLDAFEWGAGADVTRSGVFALAQVTQIVLLEDAPRLLIGEPETRLLALLRRRFWQDRIELELRGVYAVERGGWFTYPRVSWWIRDDLRLRLGYLAIGGPRNSLFGQFGRNDEVVFQLRQSF